MKLAQRILRVNCHGFVDCDKGSFRFLQGVLYLRNIRKQYYWSYVTKERCVFPMIAVIAKPK